MTFLKRYQDARHRKTLGWTVLLLLSLAELLAMLFGKPSVVSANHMITQVILHVGEVVPVVQTFGRCAARTDVGTASMLALNVLFFPLKLGAILYAYPRKIPRLDKSWRGAFELFYVGMIGLVALVPTYVWGWIFAPGASGLSSIDRKTSALCTGGFPGFFVGAVQSAFTLVCAYVSLVILIGLIHNIAGSERVGR